MPKTAKTAKTAKKTMPKKTMPKKTMPKKTMPKKPVVGAVVAGLVTIAVDLASAVFRIEKTTVEWFTSMLELTIEEMHEFLDAYIDALNTATHTRQIGFRALLTNAWAKHGYRTYSIYAAYGLAEKVVEKRATILAKGIAETWHIDLLDMLVSIMPTKEGEKLPCNVATAVARLAAVLGTRGKKEAKDNGWLCPMDVFRGMSKDRLTALFMNDEYAAPAKSKGKKAKLLGSLLDVLYSRLRYIIPQKQYADVILGLVLLFETDSVRAVKIIKDLSAIIHADDIAGLLNPDYRGILMSRLDWDDGKGKKSAHSGDEGEDEDEDEDEGEDE